MIRDQNPLLDDATVEFLLYDVHGLDDLLRLPAFAEHQRETIDLALGTARRFAREVLYATYKPMDAEPPVFRDGHVTLHPLMRRIYPQLVAAGLIAASRPPEVGGQNLPLMVATFCEAYLGAANLSAVGILGLTRGAAHLLEAFGSETLRETFMTPLYAGEWTGTMALTEPHAGSSLADVRTTAEERPDGSFAIRGSKIFISGGDHDLTSNIVHMTLARTPGAPPGIKGVSLFAVPKQRIEHGALVPNDVSVAGAIHKIGWRGLPSLALNFGDHDDCRGWLVGERNKGIAYMFQMMNEARIMVGTSAAATASVAYHESVAYALSRPQGRSATNRDATTPQVPIFEHADVRRMLLRQKAIVEGSFSLLAATARYADVAHHHLDAESRQRAQWMLDLLTPVAKSFPAERGFESNALALQVHGGYGYSSEYLPESWLRDQKLNTLHEGTTGIQGLDLLGRKVVAGGGAALQTWHDEVSGTIARARSSAVDPAWCDALASAIETVRDLTATLGARGLEGDVAGMLLHSADYLELFSVVTVAWQWLAMAAAARERIVREGDESAFVAGKLRAAQYWIHTELPRVEVLATLCRTGEDSYEGLVPGSM